MPEYTYPGVYIEEVPSGVRPITNVSTSIAAFVGRAKRGAIGEPVFCFDLGDFNRWYGGLWADGPLSYAVKDFFLNGGSKAIIVRLFKPYDPQVDTGTAQITVGNLSLEASNPGIWGNSLRVRIDYPEDQLAAEAFASRFPDLVVDDLFDLTVEDKGTGIKEVFRNLAGKVDAQGCRVDRVLASSNLVRVKTDSNGPILPGERPRNGSEGIGQGGNDGDGLDPGFIIGEEDKKTGIFALLKTDIFNILCIPPNKRGDDTPRSVWEKAAALCRKRRAFLIIDSPAAWDADPHTAAATVKTAQTNSPIIPLANGANAALYFPRIRQSDPLRGGQLESFVPCGAVAGIMARTDGTRGVWKAPAGIDASIGGAQELMVSLTDQENGTLNSIGVNCLRMFPAIGCVVWGARTLRGADQLADEDKYVPVRRFALYIEDSLYRGTQWVVFEPNDQPLWAEIRLSVGAFMHRLFRQGAFQGGNPGESYFVKCDSETNTQNDINLGVVNIIVGFAPLRPAEFVIIKIKQIRGEIQT